MNKAFRILTLALAVVGAVAITVSLSGRMFAQERENEENESVAKGSISRPDGKITPWAAMAIAAKKAGGMPVEAVYEFEEGQWIYGVVVVKNHKLSELEIDPTTGKVKDSEGVSPADEAKEFQAHLAKLEKLGS